MPFASTDLSDFGGGIHRGRKAPPNALYDAVNALINDEGLPYRRGGSAYFSGSAAAAAFERIASGYYAAVGPRTTAAAGGTRFYAFNAAGTPTLLSSSIALPGRFSSVGAFAAAANGPASIVFYAGSLKTSTYSTGTIGAITSGDTTVTGVGTSWLANADAGMILDVSGPYGPLVVLSVDSDTQLTLTAPSPLVTAPGYTLRPVMVVSTSGLMANTVAPPAIGSRSFVAAAGSGIPKLIFTIGNRAYVSTRSVSDLDPPGMFENDVYLDIPSGAEIIGAEGSGESALLFTTGGVWRAGNLTLNPVDAFGNQQWTLEQINKDMVLWGDLGITNWAGAAVVPALDDVYLLGLDGSAIPITGDASNEKVRRLYRSYTAVSGYQPGIACVYGAHLFLPVLNGSTLVDVLVCRLDRGAAWTRWAGHAAGLGYAVQPATSSTRAKLLGLASTRITDLTDTFAPSASNTTDADSTTSDLVLTTSDLPTGANQPGFAAKIRARYELVASGSPTVTMAYSSDQDAGVFTTLTEKGLEGGGTGGGTSDGSKYNWWLVAKRRERIRFRLTVAGACTSFVLRSLELLTRPSGKQ